jgi:hypothetical protein
MNEIEWLAERRPQTGEADAAATARARAALLERAETPRRPAPRRGPSPGVARRRRIVAGAAVASVAAVVAASSLPAGDRAPRLATQAAEAAPLVRLSARIKQTPPPSGDATLVLRRHAFPNARGFTGADLYLDDGRYFYGSTLAELRAGAAANPEANTGDNDTAKAERQAAIEALTDAGKARADMIAIFSPAPGAEKPAKAARAQKLKAAKVKPVATASPRSIANNRVWIGAMDALIAGAGRVDVRAGVMKLLAMMPEVKVEPGDGVLNIRMTDFPDGYEETLVVDEDTGVIEKMIGGTHGRRPSVEVTYDVRRVTAADVLH